MTEVSARFASAESDKFDLFSGQAWAIALDAGGIERFADVLLAAADFVFVVKDLQDKVDLAVPAIGTKVVVPVRLQLSAVPFDLPCLLTLYRDDPDSMTIKQVEAKIDAEVVLWGLKLHPSKATVTLGHEPWQLELSPSDAADDSVASLQILGVEMDLTSLTLNAAGVVAGEAHADIAKELGNLTAMRAVKVVSGSAFLAGQLCRANLLLAFELDYFVGAKGELDLSVSRGGPGEPWQVAASTHVATGVRWTDPSGWLAFDNVGVTVDVGNTAPVPGSDVGGLDLKRIRASGTMTFGAVELEDAATKQWLRQLFSGLKTEFRDLDLANLSIGSVEFEPPGGLHVKALDVFDLHIPRIKLENRSFTLNEPTLGLKIGDADLSGSLGALKVELSGVPTIDVKSFDVAMTMSAPGGVKASARLKHICTEVLDVLEGDGQLTTATFPGVKVMFRIGKFREQNGSPWHPTLVLYASEDVDIVLFPGVVVRTLALGLGINAEVEGTSRLTLAAARRRLEAGLPDVGRPESWIAKQTALTLLARAFFSSSKGLRSVVDPYVGDMTLIVTSDFQFAALGKLWLQTSVDDAATTPFQQRPAATAMMLLDGKEPSLRMVAQTRSDGLNSLKLDGVAGRLLGTSLPETRFAFEATSAGLAVVIGPSTIAGDLGPLKVSGSALLAFRSVSDRAYVVVRAGLQASYGSPASLSLGLVSITASLGFGFSAELVLLGWYEDKKLAVYGNAHVTAFVDVQLHLRIGFRIRIGLPFGRSITISWDRDWDFHWQVHVDLQVELALDSAGSVGLVGRASISVHVMGVSATLSVPVDIAGDVVDAGRARRDAVEGELKKLLEAAP